MAVIASLATWFLGRIADLAVEEGAKGLWGRIRDKQARSALAQICANSIEAAVASAPSLYDDLRSESFCSILIPLVQGLLEDPEKLLDAEILSARFVDMFVNRFSARDGVDETLARIFHTNRAELLKAFVALLQSLKSELYASDYWREAQHYRSSEQTLSGVTRILEILEAQETANRARRVDMGLALEDAYIASAQLRAWPSEIHGMRLETPAFERVLRRVVDEPIARTLLIGEAGSGKSALLARLTEALEARDITVFAIKADLLPPSIGTLDDLARALGVNEGLEDRISALATERPVALIIDQLDAVSDVMDRHSHRMQLLLQLVHHLDVKSRFGPSSQGVHVLISSRPFEVAHDARFQQLKAEPLRLDWLDEKQVTSLIERLNLKVADVPADLRETLRRPFALKLFADVVVRGGYTDQLASADLLDSWLATADLGAPPDREAVSRFLISFAAEMVATETLWRPADKFDLDHGKAVRLAEAAGLIFRTGGLLGFAHQSWLDDFQAKSFRTGGELAEYAWERQDSLFVRASILRSLERMRVRDASGYATALKALLGDVRTRRHIKHLLADMIATMPDSLPAEIAWIQHWVRNDVPLALRSLGSVAQRWDIWRDALRRDLPYLMTSSAYHWHAARLLGGEARHDGAHVARLIDQYWSDPARDLLVFEILELSGFIGLDVMKRLATIFGRTKIEDHQISHLITTLRAEQRFTEAADIVALWLDHTEVGRTAHPQIHDLEKLAEAAPAVLGERLLPWFLVTASAHVDPAHDVMADFPRSHSLPYEWGIEKGHGSPFEALLISVKLLAQRDPDKMWSLLQPLFDVAIDQVQELVAVGLAAAGTALASQSLEFLLADPRRFSISSVIGNHGGSIKSIEGWHSQELLRAIVPGLLERDLRRLREAIETWSPFTDGALSNEEPDLVARRLQWSDEARFPLLEILPSHLLESTRLAQIAAWRSQQPLIELESGEAMAGWVGPPVTHDEMAEMTDEEILRHLDEHPDGTTETFFKRPISRSGGARELSYAFGEFAKARPDRGLSIGASLQSGKHELAAGALVRDLSSLENSDADKILALILDLEKRGFASPDWRHDAANALGTISRRLGGLKDDVLATMEQWIERNPSTIDDQIEQRLAFEAKNPSRRDRSDRPEQILFGSTGGLHTLPHDNFTILSAISNGLLCRTPPDCDGWASVLVRHLSDPEDPAIWSNILMWRGEWLTWSDKENVEAFLTALWEKYPGAWSDVRMTRVIWRLRSRIEIKVLVAAMIGWLASQDTECQQAAGELITAAHLVDPESAVYDALFQSLDQDNEAVATGLLFSAATAWREDDPLLRSRAHRLLIGRVSNAKGPQAHALARALSGSSYLQPDQMTREFLLEIKDHPTALEACLGHGFSQRLQTLLFHPDFDDVVLAVVDAITRLIADAARPARHYLGKEFVQVTIALQRSDGPIRARAMDVYEQLLDAGIYGAQEAAKASLERH